MVVAQWRTPLISNLFFSSHFPISSTDTDHGSKFEPLRRSPFFYQRRGARANAVCRSFFSFFPPDAGAGQVTGRLYFVRLSFMYILLHDVVHISCAVDQRTHRRKMRRRRCGYDPNAPQPSSSLITAMSSLARMAHICMHDVRTYRGIRTRLIVTSSSPKEGNQAKKSSLSLVSLFLFFFF